MNNLMNNVIEGNAGACVTKEFISKATYRHSRESGNPATILDSPVKPENDKHGFTNALISKYGFECFCPYVGPQDICTVSINLIAITPHLKTSFCRTENYDNCPLFLSKVLRRR